MRASEIVFIAVGTPMGEDGSADLQHVLGVAREIAKAMNGYKVIVNKSTVPVGTAERVRTVVRRETTHPFSVVSNPEFLKQGAAIEDFMKPDRVVIGAEDPRASELMQELYAPFTRTGAPIMVMDCASAELSKYAANAMLATRVSFMNEVANVCDAVKADVDHVRMAVAADRRIGSSFLFPGAGYGGSCFPKDVKALLRFSREQQYNFQILRAVEAVNEAQKARMLRKLEAHFGSLKGRHIGVWGLAFKPRTDDMREAPAITVIQGLLAARRAGAGVRPGGAQGGARHLRREDRLRRQRLRRAHRRGRARHHDRVERVPPARFRADETPDADGGRRGRAEHLRSRAHPGGRLHVLFGWAAVSTVLVVGGAGYIGSHAAKMLRRAGYDVVVYDDLSAGHREAALGAPLVEGGIHDVARLRETLRAHDVAAVMHFAAWASVADSVRDPRGYYWNNVTGTLAVLEAMVAESVTGFVFSSSAAVFGEPEETPITEAHPTRPINPYGETKLAVERALPHYERAYGIRSVSLRVLQRGGRRPGGGAGRVARPRDARDPARHRGGAGPGRAADLRRRLPDAGRHVPARLRARDGPRRGPPARAPGARAGRARRTAYNLGCGRPASVREVVAAVARTAGRPVPAAVAPRRPGDPAVLYASSDAIARDLGWRPRFGDLDTIVETAWRWHERRRGH